MVQIIDDFLSDDVFRHIKKIIMSDDFPWYFNEGILDYNEKERYQFTHTFFASGSQHVHFNLIRPCLYKLNV